MGLFNFLFRKNKKNQRSEAIEITYENLAVMNEHDPNYIKDRVLQYRTEHIEMLVQKGEFGENFDMKKMKLVEKALKFIGEWDLDYYKQNGNNAYLHRIAGRTATLKGSVFDFFHMAYENKMNKESGLLLYECASLFAITKHELFFIHATKMSFYFYPLKDIKMH
jgi:hypothetical protein